MAVTSSLLTRWISFTLVAALLTTSAMAANAPQGDQPTGAQGSAPVQQPTSPVADPGTTSTTGQSQPAQADQDTLSGPDSTQANPALPSDPGSTVQTQPASPASQPSGLQQPPQSHTPQPAGAAAAQVENTTGEAAYKPAGAAIAPAKQRRARMLLIKVGVLVAAGVAIGSVAALSSASPSRPPGSH